MRRRQFITAAGGIGAALSSAGCTSLAATPIGDTGATTEPSVTGSNTQVDELNVNGQFIHVAASGTVETEPDTASISVAIEASGSEAEAVREELASRAEELKDALLEYGLDEEQITTGRYDIREHRNEGSYRGMNEFRINVEDVDSVGELIDTAVDSGADEIGRIHFGVSEGRRDELREEAIKLAADNARQEAEVVAEAKGLTITGVQTVSTDPGRVRPYRASVGFAEAAAGDASGAPTQIDQGPVTVSAQIEVTYRFEQ